MPCTTGGIFVSKFSGFGLGLVGDKSESQAEPQLCPMSLCGSPGPSGSPMRPSTLTLYPHEGLVRSAGLGQNALIWRLMLSSGFGLEARVSGSIPTRQSIKPKHTQTLLYSDRTGNRPRLSLWLVRSQNMHTTCSLTTLPPILAAA